jgi:metal-responsive CopG/Arc/MetJ family transcriptional regulator
MRTSVDLDDELAEELERAVSLVRESQATVIRMAIRAGLPLIENRFQSPRRESYFAGAYRTLPKERVDVEAAFARGMKVSPDR